MKWSHFWVFMAVALIGGSTAGFALSTLVDIEDGSLSWSAPGDASLDYLRNDTYTKLLIEIDAVPGWGPYSGSLAIFENVMRKHLDKENYTFSINYELDSSGGNYSNTDIIALERAHRGNYSDDNTAVLYVMFLDGSYASDENVVGLAYSATSFAVFKSLLLSIPIPVWAEPYVSHTDFEASTMVHEMGHILGLVAINYEAVAGHEHEDPEHPHHTVNESCVMYYAIEGVRIADIIHGGDPKPPVDFGSECSFDLAGIKNGSIPIVKKSADSLI